MICKKDYDNTIASFVEIMNDNNRDICIVMDESTPEA